MRNIELVMSAYFTQVANWKEQEFVSKFDGNGTEYEQRQERECEQGNCYTGIPGNENQEPISATNTNTRIS